MAERKVGGGAGGGGKGECVDERKGFGGWVTSHSFIFTHLVPPALGFMSLHLLTWVSPPV